MRREARMRTYSHGAGQQGADGEDALHAMRPAGREVPVVCSIKYSREELARWCPVTRTTMLFGLARVVTGSGAFYIDHVEIGSIDRVKV